MSETFEGKLAALEAAVQAVCDAAGGGTDSYDLDGLEDANQRLGLVRTATMDARQAIKPALEGLRAAHEIQRRNANAPTIRLMGEPWVRQWLRDDAKPQSMQPAGIESQSAMGQLGAKKGN